MMDSTDPKQKPPSSVPATAQQDRELYARWVWTEGSVWTARMLTALEQGVKGGVWFRLIDKVFSERNLHAAGCKVCANKGAPGVDHVTVEAYEQHWDDNLRKLAEDLRQGTYRPQAIRRTYIPKLGSSELRPLGIPSVRDRIVQAALRHVIEPIFEKEFAPQSYGFRPRKGCKDALLRVDQLIKQGYVYVVDADLKSYFDTIPHEPLMGLLRERIADRRVLALIEAFLKAGIMDGLHEWTPEEGAPQGAVISPLLSNIYLNPLDHHLAQQGLEMVRYADDFVILCRTREEADQALALVQQWTTTHGLTLHPTKTKIVDVRTEGFDFLGYHFKEEMHFPRKKSLGKLRASIRAKTKRANGRCMPAIIADVNATLRGWFGYFKHAWPTTFPEIDGWIRGRLRSILRKRQGRRGRARGKDHQRWPNKYFHQLGLFNLTTAHSLARQSSVR